MDSVKIISHVKNYQTIGNESLVDIAALKKKYPWFSTLHILEAKCLKNENKFGLKKSIKTASLFAGDREVLYDFIHDEVEIEKTQTANQPLKSEPTSTPPKQKTNEIVTKPAEPPKVEANKEVKIKVEDTAKDSVKVDVAAKNNEQIKPKLDKPADITEQTEKKLEEHVKPKPLKSESPEVQTKKEKPIEQSEIDSPKVPQPTISYDPLIELQSKIVEPIEKVISPPTKVYDPLVELPKLEEKEKAKKPSKQDFYSWLDSLEEEEVPTEPKPRKLKMSAEASQLLENFIKNRPNISRIRTDIDRTEIHKEDKENTGFELVTESLAQLHIKQGRPEKAIDIYEKLRLQNPQKFSYFAALIEKTKKENNLE